MKKILFLAMLLPALSFAQEIKEEIKTEEVQKRFTISGNYTFSDPSQFGVSLEYKSKKTDDGRNYSHLLNLSGAKMDYESNIADIDGDGFVVELGSRTYIEKGKWEGFYGENFISYGNVKFDENIAGLGKFDGTYSYWSIINPNVGYRFILGEHLCIDPSIGANWKWEVKGKGDVDNKNVDNFVFRAGIKIGYNF
ncbi:hypothetical protein [uncultured Flavobacterium sp.]|uniref:hypothetical protein n=1 Tax=uncultured Flavobacterium sp. TaxID=165435 RepID=UPI0025E1C25E|nr:hypothetical protein [uncultured Flavobacterium sp.]